MATLAPVPTGNQSSQSLENFCTDIKTYYQYAQELEKLINTNVLRLANYLPRPIAVITYHLWKATPYIAAELFFSRAVFIIGVIGVIAIKLILTSAQERTNLSSLWNGIGFSLIISGTTSFITGCALDHILTAFKGMYLVFGGGSILYYSGLVKKVMDACNQPDN